jgi:hypothetical protein
MTSDSNYAVRPPSGQGEVSNLPAVSQTADRLLGRMPRRGGRKDQRRGPRPSPSPGGAPQSPPGTAEPTAGGRPAQGGDAEGADDEHVDYYI